MSFLRPCVSLRALCGANGSGRCEPVCVWRVYRGARVIRSGRACAPALFAARGNAATARRAVAARLPRSGATARRAVAIAISAQFVGDLDLRGDGLFAGLHRYRRAGLGGLVAHHRG